MDTLNRYRAIIHEILKEYAHRYAATEEEDVETTILSDDEHGEYLVMRVGWRGEKRVRRPVFYLRLRHDKIRIEEDWTEAGIVTDLLAAGVPHQNIVLAFNPPLVRHLTDFAS